MCPESTNHETREAFAYPDLVDRLERLASDASLCDSPRKLEAIRDGLLSLASDVATGCALAPSHTERGRGKCYRNPPCPDGECHFRDPGCSPERKDGRSAPAVTKNVGDDRTGETDENLRVGDTCETCGMVTVGNWFGKPVWIGCDCDPHPEGPQDSGLATDQTKAEPLGEAPKPESAAADPVVSDREAGTDRDKAWRDYLIGQLDLSARVIDRDKVTVDDAMNAFHDWVDDFYRDSRAHSPAVPGDGQLRERIEEIELTLRGGFPNIADALRAALDGDKEGPA